MRNSTKLIIGLLLCLALCTGEGCNKGVSKQTTTSDVMTNQGVSTISKAPRVTIVNNSNQSLVFHQENSTHIQKIMNAIALKTSYYPSQEISLNEVQKYVHVSQLRSISVKDDEYGDLKFYSVCTDVSGGRLYIFYGYEKDAGYCARYCFFLNKSLYLRDFDSLENGLSTLDDVAKIDPAAKFNFFDLDLTEPQWQATLLDQLTRTSFYYSAHVTKDGIINVSYKHIGLASQRQGQNFIVDGISDTPSAMVASIVKSDWP